MPLNFHDLYPSRYVKAADLRGQTIAVTIEHVEVETMPDKKTKPVLYFRGKDKGLVLNKTNATVIAYDLGEDLSRWVGEKIDIYATRVTGPNGVTDGIRVKPVRKITPATPAAPAGDPLPDDSIPF